MNETQKKIMLEKREHLEMELKMVKKDIESGEKALKRNKDLANTKEKEIKDLSE